VAVEICASSRADLQMGTGDMTDGMGKPGDGKGAVRRQGGKRQKSGQNRAVEERNGTGKGEGNKLGSRKKLWET